MRHSHGAAASNSRRALRPLVGRSVVAAARGPATCAATGDGSKQQPSKDACIVWQYGLLGVGHRDSQCIARSAAPHARERPVRRPSLSASAPAADHAAALWQLCCRIGRTTTVAFQMVGSHARGHNLPRATGARRGVNSGAAQRAGDGSRAYPANRHHVCIRTRSCVRRLPIFLSIGAAFGGDPETGKLTGVLAGRGRVPCAVGRHAARASGTPRQNTGRAQHHDGSTNAVSVLKSPPRSSPSYSCGASAPEQLGTSSGWPTSSAPSPLSPPSVPNTRSAPRPPPHPLRLPPPLP